MPRLDNLNARRIDPFVENAKLLNESYRSIAQSDAVKYVIGAMQPIDPEYTKNTFAQAERISNQLSKRLIETCEYTYQGSVTNDTHIKAKSDIDLLVIIGKFFTVEQPQTPNFPYAGNPTQDLLDLRSDVESALAAAFPQANLDCSGCKSITIEGGSLTRTVDVVPSNWYITNKYTETQNEIYRGVEILDTSVPRRLANTPFLHNAWIEYKDNNTGGGLRKAARLMKSLKYDCESIELSSYDIVSLAFNMPDTYLNYPRGSELLLLSSCLDYCREVLRNSVLRNSLKVPDGHRNVFAERHATENGLAQLVYELDALASDVLRENQRSFRKLAEARVDY